MLREEEVRVHDSHISSQALSYAAMLCDYVFVDDAIADPDAPLLHGRPL